MKLGVWVEAAHDGGSAVWGCATCERGGWCSDHTTARTEARIHARAHGTVTTVATVGRRHGPKPDVDRDRSIRELRSAGHSARAIATSVGISHAGVLAALRRMARAE